MSSGGLAIIIGGLIGALGVVYGSIVTQRNRRTDRREQRDAASISARVQDSKNALDAWISISAANTSQIASLTMRVDNLLRQVQEYEQRIVPDLEAKIAEQQQLITELTGKISELEATILELRQQIARLTRPET